jgi:hypothetical protein
VLLDDQVELVVFDLLFRAAPLTADFHQKTAGASGLYIKKKDESRWRRWKNKNGGSRTGNCSTGREGLGNSGVQGNVEIFLDRELLVPLEDPLVNPSSEGLSNDRIHYVNYILSRKFANFPEDGQTPDDLRLGEGVVEDAIERKGLVLRNK